MTSIRDYLEMVRVAEEKIAVWTLVKEHLQELLKSDLQVDGRMVQNTTVTAVIADVEDMRRLVESGLERMVSTELVEAAKAEAKKEKRDGIPKSINPKSGGSQPRRTR